MIVSLCRVEKFKFDNRELFSVVCFEAHSGGVEQQTRDDESFELIWVEELKKEKLTRQEFLVGGALGFPRIKTQLEMITRHEINSKNTHRDIPKTLQEAQTKMEVKLSLVACRNSIARKLE